MDPVFKMNLRVRRTPKRKWTGTDTETRGNSTSKKTRRFSKTGEQKLKDTAATVEVQAETETLPNDFPSSVTVIVSQIKDLLSGFCDLNCQACYEIILKLGQHMCFDHELKFLTCAAGESDSVSAPGIHTDPCHPLTDLDLGNVNVDDKDIDNDIQTSESDLNPDPDPEYEPQSSKKDKKVKKKRKYRFQGPRCPLCSCRLPRENLDEHLKTHSTFKVPQKGDRLMDTAFELVTVAVAEAAAAVAADEVTQDQQQVKAQDKRIIKCPSCPASFYKNSTYEKHVKDVHDPNKITFRCPISECMGQFSSCTKLTRHFKASHPESKSLYVCSICNQETRSMGLLRTHVARYHCDQEKTPRPFQCTFAPGECTKSFFLKRRLDDHVRSIHTKETPFFCSKCGKGISSRHGLLSHERTHDPEWQTKVKCEFCGKGFQDLYKLNRHLPIHTGVIFNPHICDQCGKEFSEKSGLRTHYKKHTMEPCD